MSNIFNRQTTALKLPDSVEINDNTNSLSTSSSVAPTFVAGGSAIIEKDLKVDDIAYLNECRINTLPTSTIDAKQAFTNYVSLVGQKINNKKNQPKLLQEMSQGMWVKVTQCLISNFVCTLPLKRGHLYKRTLKISNHLSL